MDVGLATLVVAFITLLLAAATLFVAYKTWRQPLTRVVFDPATWKTTREGDRLMISGRVHFQPIGAGYTVTRLQLKLDGTTSEFGTGEFRIGEAHQGMGDQDYTFFAPDRGRNRVDMRVSVSLADGSRASFHRSLPIQKSD
jgi:hypothetical protein